MSREAQAGEGPTTTLSYIQSMLGQLRVLSEMEDAHMLTYLIDMAFEEARESIRERLPVLEEDDRHSAA